MVVQRTIYIRKCSSTNAVMPCHSALQYFATHKTVTEDFGKNYLNILAFYKFSF